MKQAHYFRTRVEIYDNCGLLKVISNAMVSREGIFRAFEETPEVHQAFLEAQTFAVRLEKQIIRGRLVREQGEEGAHYNIRLLDISKDAKAAMALVLQQIGFESPWKRKFMRLSAASIGETLEVPSTVTFPRVAFQAIGNVINFSYHGMLFEFRTTGISLGEQVGQTVQFHLVTNRGLIVSDVEAQVTRIYDEMYTPKKMIRGLGVKFVYIEAVMRKRYHSLIACACQELKRSAEESLS